MSRQTGVYVSLSLCGQMNERVLDVENEAMLKIVELEKQLMQTNKELDHIRVTHMFLMKCCNVPLNPG